TLFFVVFVDKILMSQLTIEIQTVSHEDSKMVLPDVEIILLKEDSIFQQVSTDQDGKASLKAIPYQNNFSLVIHKNGFISKKATFDLNTSNKDYSKVTLQKIEVNLEHG